MTKKEFTDYLVNMHWSQGSHKKSSEGYEYWYSPMRCFRYEITDTKATYCELFDFDECSPHTYMLNKLSIKDGKVYLIK